MRKILISLSIIGIVAVIAIGATVAYFGDVETSTGNTFSAGTIDLKIDYRCEDGACEVPMKNLGPGDDFFDECDIKPGDKGEVTISWHVTSNKAWGRLRIADIEDWEYECTEPEEDVDTTCGIDPAGEGFGELSQYLKFTAWMDEGNMEGWQCGSDQGGCPADLKEGNNVFDVGTFDEMIAENKSVSEFMSGFELPEELNPSTTYFVGLEYNLPSATGNIIQTDSLVASFVMEVVQSKNNPSPW